MAGEGSRLKEFFDEPKPYIKINDKRIIEIVIENIKFDCNYILVARSESAIEYKLDQIATKKLESFKILTLDEKTEGAAISAQKAKRFIDNDEELIIVNSDQYLEGNIKNAINYFRNEDADGGILTVKKYGENKWSYVKINDQGVATRVAEKEPISDNATVGLYYFKKGSDFIKFSEEMVEKNIRVNNEFYLCPVYNQFIAHDKKILIYEIENLWPLGTFEEIEEFKKFLN